MQRNSTKRNAYYTGRSAAGQELIYQHMSNHYRRILNAKKVVDTSPPYCYKQKRPSSSHVVPGLSTARSCKVKHPFLGRNTSPAATDRSVSTNSYSAATGAYPSSRYHMGCIEDLSNPTKKYVIDKHLMEPLGGGNGAPSYCQDNWTDVKAVESRSKVLGQGINCRCDANLQKNAKRPFQTREAESLRKGVYSVQEKPSPTDISAKGNHFYPSSNSTFMPKILPTNALSKLRSLRVYYPPRRRGKRGEKKTSPEVPIDCAAENPTCKCWKICVCESKKASISPGKDQLQSSSRDSAYNGGVSSLPESRSPTPDRRNKKEACGYSEEEEKFFRSKGHRSMENRIQQKTKSTGSPHTGTERGKLSPTNKEKMNGDDSFRKMKEDDLYIKLIEDITVEILEKCLYTNKALKKVMKKHILANLQTLDKVRMLKEVDYLRLRLGIPEDQSLFDLDLTISNSNGDLRSVCTIISDSEFMIPDVAFSPRRDVAGDNKKAPRNFPAAGREQNLIKAVISGSENEDELISVIQAEKGNGGDKKSGNSDSKSPESFEYDKYSSDESEESFDGLKRSTIKDVKKHMDMIEEVKRQDNSDSDSSEIEENISEENLLDAEDTEKREDINEVNCHKDESTTGREFSVSSADYKKNRTVSFWSLNNVEGHKSTFEKRDSDEKQDEFQGKKAELQKWLI